MPILEISRHHSTKRKKNIDTLLHKIDDGLIGEERPTLASLVNWSRASDAPIHRWFRYREGFSPELISELGLGKHILDPFCGSGSIMVGSAQQQRTAIGIDINPLAAFAARVKLSPLTSHEITAVNKFIENFESKLLTIEPSPLPNLGIAHKVFEPEILVTIQRLSSLINQFNDRPPVRDFLHLAWISILQDVGSYFKEGNGIKYRNKKRLKDGYIHRVEGNWQMERFGADQCQFVYNIFRSKLNEMLSDTIIWLDGNWRDQKIIWGNSIEEVALMEKFTFDSVVFSPPYANRFDYFESMKVELWFGGFVNSYGDMNVLRKRSLRSHLGAALQNSSESFEEVQELIELIDPDSYAIRMRIPNLLRGYFADMFSILQSCRAALKTGGDCNIIVGNSAYGGVIIPTDTLIARIGIKAGFEKAKVIPVRHLTVAPQQRNELQGCEKFMRESVVVFS